MNDVRCGLAALVLPLWALAQDARADPRLTAVYTLADHHTTRWTSEKDPITKIAGVCRMVSGQTAYTLACLIPPVSEPRTGQRHYYSIAVFRDLDENHYLAACSAASRNASCDDLRAGQTFSAEVEDQTIRIVIHGEQLPLRILEFRPRLPVTTDSPTRGTPSNTRLSPGAPSKVPYSNAPHARGAPSDARPSQVSDAAGAPSPVPPSDVSTAVSSPTSARLYISCSNASARIYVDGQLIGPPPADVPLTPGRHTVSVRAAGVPEWVRRVEVPAGRTTRITAELRR